jgi:hypothetical protein
VLAGHLADVYSSCPLQSTYQLDKYIKHTAPHSVSTSQPLLSLFANPATSQYKDYIVTALNAGAVRIDDKGRKNFIYAAGRRTGFSYEYSVPVKPVDGILVVLTSLSAKIHGFPTATSSLRTERCFDCEQLVLADHDLIFPPSHTF